MKKICFANGVDNLLSVLFFVSIFSSVMWVVYTVLYFKANLAGNDMSSLPVGDITLYIGLIIIPVWALWQIFGLISRHKTGVSTEKKLVQLFNQMKKNQDYTDLIVRVMLDAEHEIKDGFVVNKFDIFVADMNEILADIVQRCNLASSLQMEQLWAKVKNGERWAIAKTLVETSKSHNDFASYLAQKSQKDEVFKGTLLEFCYRYQNLTALLEKHDRDRIFITILETGVMGKAYSILAPVADATNFIPEIEPETHLDNDETVDISEHILEMKEPERIEPSVSIWKKLNPFKKENQVSIQTEEDNSDDDFFMALEKSMNTPEQTHQNYTTNADEDVIQDDIPRFTVSSSGVENHVNDPHFTFDNYQEKTEPFIEFKTEDEIEERPQSEDKSTDDTNFAYPFGSWANEENYKK